MTGPGPRVVFVGLDSMDPDLVRAAAAGGRCPTLASLLARASVATTRNPLGVYVGAIWPSFSTATGCRRHGRSCYRQLARGYRSDSYGARRLRGEPFWRRANAAGLRTVVVDVPKSLFTGDVVGAQVVDWGTHDPEEDGFRASPPALEREILERVGRAPVPSCDEVRRSAEEIARFRDGLVERARRRERVLARAVAAGAPDLVAVAFTESHCAGHQLWHLHDPAHDRHDPAVRAQLGDPLLDVYAALDASLGRVLSTVPRDAHVLVLASHGMGPHHDGVALFDEVLERIEPSLPQGRAPSLAGRLGRLLDRGVTRRWSRRLRRRLGRGLPLPSRDAGRTCFMVPNNDAWAGVRVNLVGREPHGRIRPGAELDRFLDGLAQALGEVRNAVTGGPVFGRIVRTEAAHPAPHAAPMPDLMAEWRRDGPISVVASPRIGRVEGRYRGLRTGDHREDGLAMAFGPGIEPGTLAEPVAVEDLAPTMLAWLGVDWPGVDGRPVERWRGSRAVARPEAASSVRGDRV